MVVRLVFGIGAVGIAIVVTGQGWGLLNRVSWPLWFEIVLVVVLDFILYLQHVIFHAVAVFWRLHMMHHADLDCDVTTGVCFHPVEVAMTMQGCPGEEWALKAYRAYKECLMGRPIDETALCCEHAGSEA